MSLIIMNYWKPTVSIQKVIGDGSGIRINAFFPPLGFQSHQNGPLVSSILLTIKKSFQRKAD